ncbi:MAG: hypothetical protein LBU98_05810 [Alistipes sp.]|jgi:hypothetical protein|nr:hypothetical protein [Alistipes sp.]
MLRGANEDGRTLRDDFRGYNAAFLVGLSCKLTDRLDLSARCNFGLLRQVNRDEDNKNRAISLGAGWRF